VYVFFLAKVVTKTALFLTISSFACKSAREMRHPILGKLSVSCNRWPAYLDGRKQDYCLECLKSKVLEPGAGVDERASASDIGDLQGLPIDPQDEALIGEVWNDRDENDAKFILKSIQWSLVDSHDGNRLPVLNGTYKEVGSAGKEYWSDMQEIRAWIQDSRVSGALTDRELRRHRRAANASIAAVSETFGQQKLSADGASPQLAAKETETETTRSLLCKNPEAYFIEEVLQRAAMPGSAVWYKVSYGLSDRNAEAPGIPIHVWEHSSDVPRSAVEQWERARSSFKYSADEKELLKECGGSLKENQKMQVYTNAGIFVIVLNCGIIVSIESLYGAESLSQVYMHVTGLYEKHGEVLPTDFGYDDGCHLRRFAELRQHINALASDFWLKVGQYIFVDRFHWKNHKKSHAYCTNHCNPNKNRRIVGANTEVCEQTFRWFSRHKYSVNCMTPARFIFFLRIIADRRNEILLEQRT